MYMSFWWDVKISNFLFYGYNITSVVFLLATCLGLLLLALLFEWIILLQARVRHAGLVSRQQQLRRICSSESDSLLASNQEPTTSAQVPKSVVPTRKDKIVHFFQDLGLWLVQQCSSYLLMLSVMVYNGYIIIAIVLGAGIGYFIFGPAAMKIKIKNCQVLRDTFCMSDCGEPDRTALIRPDNPREMNISEVIPDCHDNVISTVIISETADTSQS